MERVAGWVSEVRRLGGIVFVEVISNLDLKPITVVVKKSKSRELWDRARRLKLGAAVIVEGEVPEKVISRKGRELHATNIRVVSEPVELPPIDPTGKTKALMETVLNYRYFALRLPEQRAIFRIRATAVDAAREFFKAHGFLEVHTPKICGAGAEGGATVFELDYFGRRAFLSQSPQLYKQMLMCGVPRVYEITPYFRAEKFNTPRHLNESWGIDAEMAFIEGPEDVMAVLERLVRHILSRIAEECREELEVLGREVRVPELPLKRLNYDEAIEILRNEGFNVRWGDDFGADEERVLGRVMAEEGHYAFFLVEYPWQAKPFYIMREGDRSRSFDLDYGGLELASGGQREHRYEVLRENMLLKGLNPEAFTFYLEAFKLGMPPHGGFGLGLDRLLMAALGFNNIREVVLFPRDRQRLIP